MLHPDTLRHMSPCKGGQRRLLTKKLTKKQSPHGISALAFCATANRPLKTVRSRRHSATQRRVFAWRFIAAEISVATMKTSAPFFSASSAYLKPQFRAQCLAHHSASDERRHCEKRKPTDDSAGHVRSPGMRGQTGPNDVAVHHHEGLVAHEPRILDTIITRLERGG